MKARYEDLKARSGNNSFRAFRRTEPKFEFNWHYHPEYEITWIVKGSGKRLVGDNFENFHPGDLVMIGKELPHTWVSDQQATGMSMAVVIQFNEDILESFLKLTEFEAIKQLLYRARLGLYYPSKNISGITHLIENLPVRKGVEKIAGLLQLLDRLCHKRYITLASPYFQPSKGELNGKRIMRIYQYIQKNSAGKISITDAAALIHLSASAFCKFFKRTTGHSFSDYVNEIRIGQACKLLAETDRTIADICYSSGFESPTYFNRIFLKKKGIRPRDFRNKNQ